MAEGSWFCGVYRYRFGFEAFIHLNDSGRYEWATRLVTDAGGEPDCEDSGTYASLPRAEGYRLHTFAHIRPLTCATPAPLGSAARAEPSATSCSNAWDSRASSRGTDSRSVAEIGGRRRLSWPDTSSA